MLTSVPHMQPSEPRADKPRDISPFLLENDSEYQAWRQQKLTAVGGGNPLLPIRVGGNCAISPPAFRSALEQVRAFNFLLFDTCGSDSGFDIEDFVQLGRRFGLNNQDANICADENRVSTLTAVAASDPHSRYIPYTTRALSWHTDGYYNAANRRIQSFSLYCVRPAERGGATFLFDHELLYLRIRDQNPELLLALMDARAMEIPPNIVGNKVLRGTETGPVFAVDDITGALSMRYSARPRNISWRDDALTRRALTLLRELLIDSDDSIEFRLSAGQGIICNNILHGRRAFNDGDEPAGKRTLWRARYRDPISITM